MRVRTLRTPGSLGRVQVARRSRRCDGHLSERHWINPGDRYVTVALPPGNSDIGNSKWWRHHMCMDCAPTEFIEADQ